MKNMVANSSAIRAMFEEGNRLAGIYGAENVFDFSLGNPNVPAPTVITIFFPSKCVSKRSFRDFATAALTSAYPQLLLVYP